MMKPLYKHKAEARARCSERHPSRGSALVDPYTRNPCATCWHDQLLLVHMDVLRWVARITQAKHPSLSENLRWVADGFEEGLGKHENLKDSITEYMKAMTKDQSQ